LVPDRVIYHTLIMISRAAYGALPILYGLCTAVVAIGLRSTRQRREEFTLRPGLAACTAALVALLTALIVRLLSYAVGNPGILWSRQPVDLLFATAYAYLLSPQAVDSLLMEAGVGVVLLVPGTAFALIAGLRHGLASLGAIVGFLSFVGFLDVCGRLPLELWASLLLSGGLAVQAARLIRPRRLPFLRLVRLNTPLLVVALMALMLLKLGGRAWSEYRAAAALPLPPAHARNVLVIVWDTVRIGILSLYGYDRQTSPNLARLAARGVRFNQAFATAPWTLPSHSSLFTGRWPHELTADWRSPLDETHPTLAEYLGTRGYDTAGFVANLDYCSQETGLSHGFAHYEDYPIVPWDVFTRYVGLGRRLDLLTPASVSNQLLQKCWGDMYDVTTRSKEHVKDAATVDRSFLAWLSWQRPRNRPFFAFLNYNDAHSPYEVPDRTIPGFGLRPIS
jgi:Sulfatase